MQRCLFIEFYTIPCLLRLNTHPCPGYGMPSGVPFPLGESEKWNTKRGLACSASRDLHGPVPCMELTLTAHLLCARLCRRGSIWSLPQACEVGPVVIPAQVTEARGGRNVRQTQLPSGGGQGQHSGHSNPRPSNQDQTAV